MDNAERAELLINMIGKACRICGLNLTIHEGKIGIVDQEQKKIIAVWNPEYTAADIPGGN